MQGNTQGKKYATAAWNLSINMKAATNFSAPTNQKGMLAKEYYQNLPVPGISEDVKVWAVEITGKESCEAGK